MSGLPLMEFRQQARRHSLTLIRVSGAGGYIAKLVKSAYILTPGLDCTLIRLASHNGRSRQGAM